MRGRYGAILALALALPAGLFAAPPEVPAEVTAAKGEVTELVVKVPAGKVLCYRLVGGEAAFREMKGSGDTERVFWLISKKGERSDIVWWLKDEEGSAVTTVNKAVAPAPPGPQPEPPAPDELKTFRAVIVFESGKTLTQSQFSAVYAKEVRDWLDTNAAEWRQYDVTTDPAASLDKPELKALWAAAKPKVGALPCFAVERNGVVSIVPTGATVADTLAKLKAAREGK